MVTTKLKIEINRPAKEVFEYLMDPGNYLVWQSGLLELEATDGMNPGSILTFMSMGLGRKHRMQAVVTENDHHASFTVVAEQGPITFQSKFLLHPTPGGTQLHISYKINTGVVFRLAESALQSISNSKYQADIESLKAILEG